MKAFKFITFILFLSTLIFASEHGIYLQTVKEIKVEIPQVEEKLLIELGKAGYNILANYEIGTPDIVREDNSKHCNLPAVLLVAAKENYTKLITSFGNKYLPASFIKIGIYETENGVNINLANPETINRIIFNDLDDDKYDNIVNKTKVYRRELVEICHTLNIGKNIEIEMPPIRDDDDLKEASKDMFMMVGKMTFFRDEDQFPIIYSEKAKNGKTDLVKLKRRILKNINNFKADKKDAEYQWVENKEMLKWRVIAEIYAPDSSAILLGISRPRTEGLSFKIAGGKLENSFNSCPGINHVTAYPIEVLIMLDDNNVIIRTQREMFRMDMYFWDAGKMAFMKYMNMPAMLDNSIKKALLGKTDN